MKIHIASYLVIRMSAPLAAQGTQGTHTQSPREGLRDHQAGGGHWATPKHIRAATTICMQCNLLVCSTHSVATTCGTMRAIMIGLVLVVQRAISYATASNTCYRQQPPLVAILNPYSSNIVLLLFFSIEEISRKRKAYYSLKEKAKKLKLEIGPDENLDLTNGNEDNQIISPFSKRKVPTNSGEGDIKPFR